MTAATLPRPAGAPTHWDYMSWSARQRWVAKHRPRPADDEAITSLSEPEPDPCTWDPPSARRTPRPSKRPRSRRDPKTSRGGLTAAEVACLVDHGVMDRASLILAAGSGPVLAAPTPTEVWTDEELTWALDEGWLSDGRRREGRTAELTLALVEALAGRAVDEVCALLDREPGTIALQLTNAGRPDLADPYAELERVRIRVHAASARRDRAAQRRGST